MDKQNETNTQADNDTLSYHYAVSGVWEIMNNEKRATKEKCDSTVKQGNMQRQNNEKP